MENDVFTVRYKILGKKVRIISLVYRQTSRRSQPGTTRQSRIFPLTASRSLVPEIWTDFHYPRSDCNYNRVTTVDCEVSKPSIARAIARLTTKRYRVRLSASLQKCARKRAYIWKINLCGVLINRTRGSFCARVSPLSRPLSWSRRFSISLFTLFRRRSGSMRFDRGREQELDRDVRAVAPRLHATTPREIGCCDSSLTWTLGQASAWLDTARAALFKSMYLFNGRSCTVLQCRAQQAKRDTMYEIQC